jgi:hypothetical protein
MLSVNPYFDDFEQRPPLTGMAHKRNFIGQMALLQ